MFDDLLDGIRAAAPSLLTLTNEETAILEAWLGDHPEPPAYACSEVVGGIGSVWEETAPADSDFWTLLRATLKYNQGREANEPPPSDDTPLTEPLAFDPGAFIYRRHREPLSGYPWEILRALSRAKGRSVTAKQLQDDIWRDDAPEESTVKSHVSKARQALQRAMEAAGIN